VKDGKRGVVRCSTHLPVPTLEITQHEAMALGEARKIETGALQAGDPIPALSGGGMDAAGNRGEIEFIDASCTITGAYGRCGSPDAYRAITLITPVGVLGVTLTLMSRSRERVRTRPERSSAGAWTANRIGSPHRAFHANGAVAMRSASPGRPAAPMWERRSSRTDQV
jgi:hypothetical protein